MQLDDNDIKDLKETFNCEAKLIKNENDSNSFVLIKRNLKIIFKEFGNLEEIQNLNNLVESLFQMLLGNNKEPILLIGPTCYKTYISKLLFPKSLLASLNEEYTISQLLGNPFYFSKDEYRNYWIYQISEHLQRPIYYIKKDLKRIIKEIHDFYKESICRKIIMERVEKLIYNEKKDEMKDIIIDFKLGLILHALFANKDLILKNFGKVKTSVLERFNDFFSNNMIALNEDFSNNFTSKYNKELKFNNHRNNRIIATIRLGEEINLSETILSRFTIINVEKYNKHEQNNILSKTIGEENIKLLNKIKPDLNMQELLNSFYITNLLDKYNKNNHKIYHLKLILYIIENGKKEKNGYENLLNIKYDIQEFDDNEFPFYLKKDAIKSKRTYLEYYSPRRKYEPKNMPKNIYFTRQFSEICDLIHFSCVLHIPLFLEGEIGQGKKTAINIMAKLIGLEVIYQGIFNSTKIDEILFNKTIIRDENEIKIKYEKSDISKELEKYYSTKIIVFDEINIASQSMLDLLTNIINKDNIIFPDGYTLKVNNPNIIVIINKAHDNKNLFKRLNLKTNYLYHIVESPDNNDLINIISTINNYKYERSIIEELWILLRKSNYFLKNNSIEPLFNLIDIKNYFDFRKNLPQIDSIYILLFIFIYKFDKPEIQEQMKKILDINLPSNFEPTIEYNKNKNKLEIYLTNNKCNDKIELDLFHKEKIINEKKVKILFYSLTKTQKLGILFLICCLKSGKIPLIQGEASTGKSYLIKVFENILGINPIVCQITSNPGIILGENIIKDISKEEKKLLKNSFNNIRDLIKEKRGFDEIKEVEYHSILSKILSVLEHKKHNQKQKKPLSHKNIKLLSNAKNIFSNILNLKSRFSQQDSIVNSAIKKGKWIFFDGIEMGDPILFEKIQSLYYENPQINIYDDSDDSDDYSLDNKNSNSPKFKFILTINPTNFNKKYITQRLFMICPIFTLTSSISNDSNLNNKGILTIQKDNLILNLSRDKIEDIEIFDMNIFKQLRFLILEENEISIFGSKNCLTAFKELEYLVLSKNKIKEIKSLADIKFDNLSYLSLSHNIINDISTLSFSNLPSIKVLDLSFNQITNINSFEKMNFPILEELYLNNNKINDISVLEKTNFQVLKILELKNNYIKKIEVLEKVKYENLEILNFEGNKIIDINVFEKVNFINSLKELYLINNPIEYYDSLNLCYFHSLKKINLSKTDQHLKIMSIKLQLYG